MVASVAQYEARDEQRPDPHHAGALMSFDRKAFAELLRTGTVEEVGAAAGAMAVTHAGGLVYGSVKPSDEILSAVLEEVDAARRDGQWPPSARG